MSSFAALFLLATTSFANAYDHKVSVGGGGQLIYTPPYISASVGDTVTFTFLEKNHTVTQSNFDTPCSPRPNGFDSGFKPVPKGSYNLPIFQFTVKDDKPIWAYCKQPGPPAHCSKGMVFAVNAPYTGNTFDAFKAKAIASGNASSTTTTTAHPWESTQSAASCTLQGGSDGGSATATVTQTVTKTETRTVTEGSKSTDAPHNAKPKTHKIIVGGTHPDGTPKLAYDPPTVDAQPGDTVTFEFHVKNHTATQSPFNAPCTALEKATHGAQVGFDSGFNFVSPNVTKDFPTFSIKVNDTKPIWGYCRQSGHCVAGMVFGINAPKTGPNTFYAFQQLAKHSNATALTATAMGYKTTTGHGYAPTTSASKWSRDLDA